MAYIHIHYSQVERQLDNGNIIAKGKEYIVIGFEPATNNFICIADKRKHDGFTKFGN